MLALALVLDALLGEPRWLWQRLPHPVVAMGRLLMVLEDRLNRGRARRIKGMFALALCLIVVGGLAMLPWLIPHGWVVEVLGGAILLAQRSLVDHVRAVAAGLQEGMEQGRAAVARIVGRETATLDETGVSRAAIESAAENFSDGVVAPAFWFLIGGLPGIALYKMINTADSMIGYRTPRFEAFGWAAARLDDAVNWAPARLTGGLFCLLAPRRATVEILWRDAPLHRSPNAGWPEAALAAALDVSLAGPRVYDGTVTGDPYVNVEGRPPARADILRAVGMLWRAWTLLLVIATLWLI